MKKLSNRSGAMFFAASAAVSVLSLAASGAEAQTKTAAKPASSVAVTQVCEQSAQYAAAVTADAIQAVYEEAHKSGRDSAEADQSVNAAVRKVIETAIKNSPCDPSSW